ncbi:MAG: hypothetical protein QOF96_292, partial [Actinomycetota bacterium]|nr:hypothetical protein [Actinomycetota bacterium]
RGEGPQLDVEAAAAPADTETAPIDLVDLRHRLAEAEMFVESGVGGRRQVPGVEGWPIGGRADGLPTLVEVDVVDVDGQ